jgi:hypothetical protein
MYKTIEVEVDVDLSDCDDGELIEVLEHRGYVVSGGNNDPVIEEIYQAMKLGKPYDELVKKLVMDRTGRIL